MALAMHCLTSVAVVAAELGPRSRAGGVRAKLRTCTWYALERVEAPGARARYAS